MSAAMMILDDGSPPWEVVVPPAPVLHVIDKKPKTRTLAARTRVNKPTLASGMPSEIVARVRTKLAKDILEQLVASGLITIKSIVNPKNGSVTFTASLDVVEEESTSDATSA